jgi:predicted metal-dependent hydrolase
MNNWVRVRVRAMSGTVNRNVAPVSAYAENRIPAKPLLKDALRAQESPQTNTLTPGQHDASVEEQNKSESINERKIENFDQEMSKNDFQQSLDELSARAGRKPEMLKLHLVSVPPRWL